MVARIHLFAVAICYWAAIVMTVGSKILSDFHYGFFSLDLTTEKVVVFFSLFFRLTLTMASLRLQFAT